MISMTITHDTCKNIMVYMSSPITCLLLASMQSEDPSSRSSGNYECQIPLNRETSKYYTHQVN